MSSMSHGSTSNNVFNLENLGHVKDNSKFFLLIVDHQKNSDTEC